MLVCFTRPGGTKIAVDPTLIAKAVQESEEGGESVTRLTIREGTLAPEVLVTESVEKVVKDVNESIQEWL